MRTLSQIRELYEPDTKDGKKFVAKHKVEKTPDANKNDDKLFNASNVNDVTRQPKHGYDPKDDEKVYEETELDEGMPSSIIKHKQRLAGMTDQQFAAEFPKETVSDDKLREMARRHGLGSRDLNHYVNRRIIGISKTEEYSCDDDKKRMRKKIKEQIELSDLLEYGPSQYDDAAGGYPVVTGKPKPALAPKPVSSSKPAPKPVPAPKPAKPYGPSQYDDAAGGYPVVKGTAKFKKEEVELDEVLKPSMGVKAYIDDFIKSKDPRFKGASKKERIQRALAAYYSAKTAKRGD